MFFKSFRVNAIDAMANFILKQYLKYNAMTTKVHTFQPPGIQNYFTLVYKYPKVVPITFRKLCKGYIIMALFSGLKFDKRSNLLNPEQRWEFIEPCSCRMHHGKSHLTYRFVIYHVPWHHLDTSCRIKVDARKRCAHARYHGASGSLNLDQAWFDCEQHWYAQPRSDMISTSA